MYKKETNYILHKSCPLCNGIYIENIMSLPSTTDQYYRGSKKEFFLYKCCSCKIIFLNPWLKDSEIGAYDFDNFLKFQEDLLIQNGIIDSKGIVNTEELKNNYPEVLNLTRCYYRHGPIVEVGSGAGAVLRLPNEEGYRAIGIEPSPKW